MRRGIGKGNLDLPGPFTLKADDASHLDQEESRLQTDGHRPQETVLMALGMDRHGAARGAAIALPRLIDREAHATLDKVGPTQVVAANAEAVIQ